MFDWLEEQQEVFTPVQMPDSEYREIPAISGTDVRTFVVEGPKTYNYFKTGLLETEETTALILGTAIHCAILEPEKFAQEYTVYAGAKPNSEQKKQFATLISEGTDRFKAYSTTYSVAKKSEDKINELANELYTELFGYILHLEKSKGKIALDEETYKTVLNCRDEVQDRINNLFSGPNFKIYTEIPLFGTYKNQKLKGKLDMLVVDSENKEVFIVDVKTTNSYKSGLRSDMLKKRYDLQLDFYEYLVNQQHCFKDFFIRKIIITVQTLGANTSAVIKLITDNNIETILDDIAYRNDTNFWRDYSTLTWEGFNIYDN